MAAAHSGATPSFSGAVLAGGASRRMGSDKALIDVGGQTMVELGVGALTAAGADQVVVVGGNRRALEALGLVWVADEYPGEGPLGGVITALACASAPVSVVLGCDHPKTAAPAVTAVVGALGEADVAVPVVNGRRQVMHAAWRTSVLPRLRARFSGGARSIRDAIDGLDVAQLLDGDPRWFADADEPADLPPHARFPSAGRAGE